MRRLLILSLCLILINALAIIAMSAIGSHIETPESRLFATGDCSQPCWHSIQPGKTTIDQAEAILRSEPDFVSNVQDRPNYACNLTWDTNTKPAFGGCIQVQEMIVKNLILTAPYLEGVPVKYPFGFFGSPIAALVCHVAFGDQVLPAKLYLTDHIRVDVWNFDGINAVFSHPERYDPEALVNIVEYWEPNAKDSDFDAKKRRWRGFINTPGVYNIGDCPSD